MNYVLDTHALVWYVNGNRRLGLRAREVLDSASGGLLIPAICLTEARFVRTQSGRLEIDSLFDAIKMDYRFRIVAIDEDIAITAARLNAVNEIHDRIIASTAIVLERRGLQVTLVTHDENITASHVAPILW